MCEAERPTIPFMKVCCLMTVVVSSLIGVIAFAQINPLVGKWEVAIYEPAAFWNVAKEYDLATDTVLGDSPYAVSIEEKVAEDFLIVSEQQATLGDKVYSYRIDGRTLIVDGVTSANVTIRWGWGIVEDKKRALYIHVIHRLSADGSKEYFLPEGVDLITSLVCQRVE